MLAQQQANMNMPMPFAYHTTPIMQQPSSPGISGGTLYSPVTEVPR